MQPLNLEAYSLYWLMIGAVLGSGITPLVWERKQRNPWQGALIGLLVGIVGGQAAGRLIILLLEPLSQWWAGGLSLVGALLALVPLWWWIKPTVQPGIRTRGFVAGTMTPFMFYLLTLSIFPLLWAIALAFFDYSPRNAGGPILGLGGDNPFVGLQHFQQMIDGSGRDGRIFQNSMGNTLLFTALVLPLNFLITIPLAVMIESVHPILKTAFRTIFFLPVVTSSVGVAVMWGYIFNANYGLLNQGLEAVGVPGVSWLQDQRATILGIPTAMVAVVIAYLWKDFGYNLVIFIAALQAIPDEMKDAARVDGAGPWQVFWNVTLPLLRPTLLVTSVLTVISSFQVFDLIQVMTQGGPGRVGQTRVLVLDIYESAFRFERMGWAAAISVVMFGVVALLTLAQTRLLRTRWEY
ncbi:MAG TPA: sugar ABC transporter permease [Aggregatilineales bacterium]|nr:sugar ABC transporter permease [Aggregatilineales bacterium]